jgi:hypothetical protein
VSVLRIVLFTDDMFVRKFYLFMFGKRNWICRLLVSLFVERVTVFYFLYLFMFLGYFSINPFIFSSPVRMAFIHQYIISVPCS